MKGIGVKLRILKKKLPILAQLASQNLLLKFEEIMFSAVS